MLFTFYKIEEKVFHHFLFPYFFPPCMEGVNKKYFLERERAKKHLEVCIKTLSLKKHSDFTKKCLKIKIIVSSNKRINQFYLTAGCLEIYFSSVY